MMCHLRRSHRCDQGRLGRHDLSQRIRSGTQAPYQRQLSMSIQLPSHLQFHNNIRQALTLPERYKQAIDSDFHQQHKQKSRQRVKTCER